MPERSARNGARPTAAIVGVGNIRSALARFREPSGVLFELATDKPGFVFEPADSLGESLVLIGDLENRRAELEKRFPVLPNPRGATTEWASKC
jgi:hypothetical protein